jgi:hypothetical protein
MQTVLGNAFQLSNLQLLSLAVYQLFNFTNPRGMGSLI